jgi:hypothetical protein
MFLYMALRFSNQLEHLKSILGAFMVDNAWGGVNYREHGHCTYTQLLPHTMSLFPIIHSPSCITYYMYPCLYTRPTLVKCNLHITTHDYTTHDFTTSWLYDAFPINQTLYSWFIFILWLRHLKYKNFRANISYNRRQLICINDATHMYFKVHMWLVLWSMYGTLWNIVSIGERCEHISSIHMFFHTIVFSLCTQNDILNWERPISWKTSIVQHLRPRCHIAKNKTFR